MTRRRRSVRAFLSLSSAILRGFLRDRASVFFSLFFPLMFLVLFGGVFSSQDRPRIEVVQVGAVSLLDQMPEGSRTAFAQAVHVTRSPRLPSALEQVRRGEADVALEERGGVVTAHYTQAEPVQAAVVQGTLRALVDGTNVAMSGQPPRYSLQTRAVEDRSLTTIQLVTPGLLGWAIAMSASFGAAATLNGWRNTRLLRRLQLAPVSTGTVVGARVAVTIGVALVQMAVFLGVGVAAFGLQLSGAWPAAVPLLLAGTLCFMAVGLLAGSVAKTTEGAVNMANFLVLPMAMLSGSFFPLDSAPPWLGLVSRLMPLRWLNDGMLDVMVRAQPASAVLVPLAALTGFALLVTAVAVKVFRWDVTP
jgi:ABC-2 type transport system permease protein